MQPRKYLYRGKTLAVETHSTVNGTGYATYFKDRKGTRHILLYNDELSLCAPPSTKRRPTLTLSRSGGASKKRYEAQRKSPSCANRKSLR